MKFWICSLLVLAPLCAAEKPPAAKSGETKKANRAQAASPATAIPAGAIETSPGNWYYTDTQGKAWFYRKTPFGVARVEEKPVAPDVDTARQQEAELKSIKAVDDGEMVRFERQGPFGVYKWSKPKTDLNEMERKAWEGGQTKAAVSSKDKQD